MNDKVELTLALSRTATKAKDEEVLNEFTLSYSGDSMPDLPAAFGISIPSESIWKNLMFDVAENYYKMKFDGMDEKVVTLKSIKVSKKLTKEGVVVYKTDISLSKDVDSWDQIFTNSYLKRKEDVIDDKSGKAKRQIVNYEVSFQKM